MDFGMVGKPFVGNLFSLLVFFLGGGEQKQRVNRILRISVA